MEISIELTHEGTKEAELYRYNVITGVVLRFNMVKLIMKSNEILSLDYVLLTCCSLCQVWYIGQQQNPPTPTLPVLSQLFSGAPFFKEKEKTPSGYKHNK